MVVAAAALWAQCLLSPEVEARKERRKLKEATPQHTEAYNSTLSNSDELDGSTKVGPHPPPIHNPIALSVVAWTCSFLAWQELQVGLGP